MTPLSAELTAEVQKQIAAVAGQETNNEGHPAKGTNTRPAAKKQGASKGSGELPVAKQGGTNPHTGNKEGVECAVGLCTDLFASITANHGRIQTVVT